MSTPENYTDLWASETSKLFKNISPGAPSADIHQATTDFVNSRCDLVANQEISSFNAPRENEFKLTIIDKALTKINVPLTNEIRQHISDTLLPSNTDFAEWLQTRNSTL